MSEDPVASSLLPPERSEYFPDEVDVPSVSLDDYRLEQGLPAPELIKLDTQGSELRILKGAAQLLEKVEAIIAEVWTRPAYGPNTPLLGHVSHWLLMQGFVAAQFGAEFRDEDGRLLHVDVLFVRPALSVTSEPPD